MSKIPKIWTLKQRMKRVSAKRAYELELRGDMAAWGAHEAWAMRIDNEMDIEKLKAMHEAWAMFIDNQMGIEKLKAMYELFLTLTS